MTSLFRRAQSRSTTSIWKQFSLRLRDNQLHLAFEKCVFAVDCSQFLGFTVDRNGVQPATQKVEALANYQLPEDYAGLRRFLGMAGYYRRFVPHYASVTAPLYNLLAMHERTPTSFACIDFANEQTLLLHMFVTVHENGQQQTTITRVKTISHPFVNYCQGA